MELDLLNLLLVLLAALAGGGIAARFGYPRVLGEIVVGILLGPPLLGLLVPTTGLLVLAELGVLLMMVYVGLQVDPQGLRRASRAGLLAALGGFLLPFGLGFVAVVAFGGGPLEALFAGIAMGVTSLVTKARILADLELLDTRIAHVMMAGALASDTFSLVLFTAVLGLVGAGVAGAPGIAPVALGLILFVASAWILATRVFPAAYRWFHGRGHSGRTFNVTVVVLVALAFGELARLAGLHPVLGAFVAGLMLRHAISSHKLAFELAGVVRDASLGFLAPLFFVTAGFLVTLDVFRTDLALLLTIVVVATVGRIVGTALLYPLSGHGWREGVVVGAGMNGRGAIEIVIAEIGYQTGIISAEVFSILVFMAIATTTTVPVFLKWGVGWLSRRGELVRPDDGRRGVVIVGAGPLARLLARQLANGSGDPPVTLIDRNAANVQEAELEGLRAVHGDALEPAVLHEAGIEAAGLLLALTPNASVNVLAAQRARDDFLVADVRAALTRLEQGGLFRVLEGAGAVPIFSVPVDVGALNLQLAERTMAGRDYDLSLIPADAAHEVDRERTLPLVVRRDGASRPFASWDALEPGEQLVVLHLS